MMRIAVPFIEYLCHSLLATTVLSASFNLTLVLCGRYYEQPHFLDKDTKTPTG